MLLPACSVCHENMKQWETILSTTCGHLFHSNCINKWLNSSTTCPQCRHDCDKTSIIRVHLTFNYEGEPEAVSKLKQAISEIDKSKRELKLIKTKCKMLKRDAEKQSEASKMLREESNMYEKKIIEIKNNKSRNEMLARYTDAKTWNQSLIEDVLRIIEKLSDVITECGRANGSHGGAMGPHRIAVANFKTNIKTLSRSNLNIGTKVKIGQSMTKNLRIVIESFRGLLKAYVTRRKQIAAGVFI